MEMIADLGWKEGDILRIGLEEKMLRIRREK
jgi:hypothetical protein